MKYCLQVGLAVLAAGTLDVRAAEPTASAKPNIVLILVDDFGYECVGANGGTSYRTPVMDKLAATGVRFDSCYAQAVCTPTRVQLMTGLYNVRNYTDFGSMDPRSVTFANLLQRDGYATCIAGKWQLGVEPDLPRKFGFDESCLWQHTRAEKQAPGRYMNPGLEINGVARDWNGKEYGPDIVSDYALDFIQRKKDQPFLLYYTMMLTHSPYDATPDSADYGEKQPGARAGIAKVRPDGINQHFTDMTAYADKLVGKLLARLDELHLRDNTLVILLGDNGTQRGVLSMMGERRVIGGKGLPTDAGMHVPLIVNWPGHAAAGQVCHDLIDTTDFLPTIMEAVGRPVPAELPFDGHSFLPQVKGQKGRPREWYYCWYAPTDAIIAEFAATHDFKLSRTGDFYDLRTDLEEKQPLTVASLKGAAAAVAKLLQGALDRYRDARPAGMAKPWSGPKTRGNRGIDRINKTDERD